jgi:hypothetical protein
VFVYYDTELLLYAPHRSFLPWRLNVMVSDVWWITNTGIIPIQTVSKRTFVDDYSVFGGRSHCYAFLIDLNASISFEMTITSETTISSPHVQTRAEVWSSLADELPKKCNHFFGCNDLRCAQFVCRFTRGWHLSYWFFAPWGGTERGCGQDWKL